jgi:hypothetical protein
MDSQDTRDSDGPRGDAAYQAERRAVAERNAEARKRGKRERKEHETRVTRMRRAASDPDVAPRQPE